MRRRSLALAGPPISAKNRGGGVALIRDRAQNSREYGMLFRYALVAVVMLFASS